MASKEMCCIRMKSMLRSCIDRRWSLCLSTRIIDIFELRHPPVSHLSIIVWSCNVSSMCFRVSFLSIGAKFGNRNIQRKHWAGKARDFIPGPHFVTKQDGIGGFLYHRLYIPYSFFISCSYYNCCLSL